MRRELVLQLKKGRLDPAYFAAKYQADIVTQFHDQWAGLRAVQNGRVIVAEGLTQGAELIQAYPRGGQRFTFTLTVDARVELQWNGQRQVQEVSGGSGFSAQNQRVAPYDSAPAPASVPVSVSASGPASAPRPTTAPGWIRLGTSVSSVSGSTLAASNA